MVNKKIKTEKEFTDFRSTNHHISKKLKSNKRFFKVFSTISFISLFWAWLNQSILLYWVGIASFIVAIVFWSEWRDLNEEYPDYKGEEEE